MKNLKQKIKKVVEIVLNNEIEMRGKDSQNYQKLLEKITIRVLDEIKNTEIEEQRETNYRIEKSICEKWDKVKKVDNEQEILNVEGKRQGLKGKFSSILN